MARSKGDSGDQSELELPSRVAQSKPDTHSEERTKDDETDLVAGAALSMGELTGPRGSSRTQEFCVPIHDYVWLTEEEIRVVDHPAFQRLGDIYQLGQVRLVYRGATHRRYEHSLGTVQVAQMIIDSINRNSNSVRAASESGDWMLDDPLTEEEIAFTRLGALTHDIGHLAAGHTLEDELGLLPKHDSDARLLLILDKEEWHGRRVTSLRKVIDENYASYVPDAAELSPSDVLLALISRDRKKVANGSLRLAVARDLIGNTICADLLDYLHRDWLHLGKPKHFDTRLLQYMEVRRRRETSDRASSVLIVNLREKERVRTDAVSGVLDLLESRYLLGEVALFHPTKLCAAAMLERVVAEIADRVADRDKWLQELSTQLVECSDSEMLTVLQDKARALAKSQKAHGDSLSAAAELARGLRIRNLHKTLMAQFVHQLSNYAPVVQERYAVCDDPEENRRRASNRLTALRLLEQDFGLPPCSLSMYCPGPGMNTKIAEVQILLDGVKYRLDEYEQWNGSASLTGGHLAAQKVRFSRLWRVHFAINEDVLNEVRQSGQLGILRRAIDGLVLGRTLGGSLDEMAHSLAVELSGIADSPLYGKTIGPAIVARRGDPLLAYPTGASSLLAHVQE